MEKIDLICSKELINKISSAPDKYWNDIWIVTLKEENELEILKCDNCGAIRENDIENKLLKCSYCRTEKYFDSRMQNWRIVDIEVV